MPSGTVRVYHGTIHDFDKFRPWKASHGSGPEIWFAESLRDARFYSMGLGRKFTPPWKQRIITADLPLDVYHEYKSPVEDDEIIMPYNVANQYVVDDGRNNPLYGNSDCYDNATMLPLNTPGVRSA